MEPRLCKVCKDPIPEGRVEALPDTEVCVNHSSEQPYRAFVEGSAKHKGFEVVIVPGTDPILDYLEDVGKQGLTGEMVGGE